MKLPPRIRFSLLPALSAALLCISTARAEAPQTPPSGGSRGGTVSLERYRGKKSVVRGGRLPQTDSLQRDTLLCDTLRGAADSTQLRPDSLSGALPVQDTLLLRLTGGDSLLRDTLPADSLLGTTPAAAPADTARVERRRHWFMSDSMSLSRVCWMSVPVPGYGQIYNKQYWKLPILYGTFGTSLALYLRENSKFKPLKRRFEEITSQDMSRTEELDAVQSAMIRHNTRRQLYLIATVGSYLYFIGDAAVNYATNDVSSVKKATTLATICPAAGQIYNKSYWKVPIVLGGFASMVYVIDWNNRGYQRFKKAYRLRYDFDQQLKAYNEWEANHKDDPDVPAPVKPTQSTDEFKGRYTAEFLKNLKNNYRRNRDLSIIATAGIYILQIVDAHVDAHLKDFDVSDDLSMRIEPAVDYAVIGGTGVRPVVGFNFMLNF
ncbi:DUF5683 domain-containing protein [Alistipes sp.]|uniref:DUF5683 domain-containing protein n=1 Tax=Alistipes sp. TaxID=1872444 RepID=UPI003A857A4F